MPSESLPVSLFAFNPHSRTYLDLISVDLDKNRQRQSTKGELTFDCSPLGLGVLPISLDILDSCIELRPASPPSSRSYLFSSSEVPNMEG
jgi:hypothetical protein